MNEKKTRWFAGMFFSVLALHGVLAPTSLTHAADVVVVCDQELRQALDPWCQLRRQEGLRLAFCQPRRTAAESAKAVREIADESTRYVVLVGDTFSFGSQNARQRSGNAEASQRRIPTFYLPSRVTGGHGSTPTYPSDLPYADFDRDGRSDASVGRLPVTTAAQLSNLIARIESYESSRDFGPWRRCLQLTAGVGGFGALVDGAIESVTRTVLTSVLPADATPQIAYASRGHAFCPPGESFRDAVMQRYRRGTRFWVYAGHGSVDRLDFLTRSSQDSAGLAEPRAIGGNAWRVESLLNNQSARQLEGTPNRAPIAVLLACYAGAYDAPGDCLSERMLLAPGGPIAVISASRLTMPYGNARFGLGLLESAYRPISHSDCPERLGDAMLASVHRLQGGTLAAGAPGNRPETGLQSVTTTQFMVDGLASLISPSGSDLALERREHAGLYQLLGDPTLRLHSPQELTMKITQRDDNDGESSPVKRRVCVSVTSPIAGTLTVCVDRPLGTSTAPETAGKSQDDARVRGVVNPAYDPHGCTISQVTVPIQSSQTGEATIPLPEDWEGPVVVRSFVQGASGWATGAKRVLVH